jgi:hypothetical protein
MIFGASFGVAAVVAIVAALGLFRWYSSRPKPWDASTIKGVSSTVTQTVTLNEKENKFIGAGFEMTFILENTSGRDYTVPQNLRLFERANKSGALQELNAKLDHPFVVPAKEKADFRAGVEYRCSTLDMDTGKETERDHAICFNEEFGDVAEFVGFDDETHTRLNLPKPTYTGAPFKPLDAANGIAPDHGEPWEKYGACAQASKLLPVCKQKGIALDDAKAAADGWTPVGPLPTLPALPKGAELQPDEQVCRIVYQWDYYCRKRGMSK